MIFHNDLKGSIPVWVVNKVCTKFPEVFVDDMYANYKKHFEKFAVMVKEMKFATKYANLPHHKDVKGQIEDNDQQHKEIIHDKSKDKSIPKGRDIELTEETYERKPEQKEYETEHLPKQSEDNMDHLKKRAGY